MKKTNKKEQEGNLINDILSSISPIEASKIEKKMLLAAKIEDAIKAKGWKNLDLLKAIGKDNPSIVTKWLSGTHNFTIDTLIEIEFALDICLLDIEEKEGKIIVKYYVMVSQPKSQLTDSYTVNDIIGSAGKSNTIYMVGSSQLGNYTQLNTEA